MVKQCKLITQTSRAFHNDQLGEFSEYMCNLLGKDKLLPCNTGVEAVETAVKLARRWGYNVKGIPDNKAKIILAKDCFWGRSITASGACDDPLRYEGFGPFTPGFELINFNDLDALSKAVKDSNVCAFIVEPIQGEAGVRIPSPGYIKAAYEICKENNVLFVADEVQTGFGRTGTLMCTDFDGIKPDMWSVGKALSGGMMPVSAVLGNDDIIMEVKPGEHGSTYGGNPLACAVSKRAIEVLIEEGMVENSREMGQLFKEELEDICSPLIKEVRGRGLFVSIELHPDSKVDGHDLTYKLMENGLLTKATHTYTVRFAPALVINEKEVIKASKIIKKSIKQIEKLNKERKQSA